LLRRPRYGGRHDALSTGAGGACVVPRWTRSRAARWRQRAAARIASRLLSYRFFRSSFEDFHSLPWRLEIERAGRRLAVVIGG
jgi:hypothetical protein